MEKRTNHITINLTDEENELINKLAEQEERKPAELARILLIRQARQQWQKQQPTDSEFEPLKFYND